MSECVHDKFMMYIAHLCARKSKDPSTKVGAVIAKPGCATLSTGYNHFDVRMRDEPELYTNRTEKYSRIIHAEVDAVMNAKFSVKGCTLYVTHFPCSACALFVIRAGIVKVVSKMPDSNMLLRWQESFERSMVFFQEAKVEVQVIS